MLTPRASSWPTAGMVQAGMARASGVPDGDQAGVGADGTGIHGTQVLRSCPWVEFSIVRLAGDSIRQGWFPGRRSMADIFTIRLMPRMFAPGGRVNITQPRRVMRTVSTRAQEQPVAPSTLGR